MNSWLPGWRLWHLVKIAQEEDEIQRASACTSHLSALFAGGQLQQLPRLLIQLPAVALEPARRLRTFRLPTSQLRCLQLLMLASPSHRQ